MVARGEDAAAALSKARDALAVGHGQPVSGVHGEEPQLVEVSGVEPAQQLVVAVRVRLTVARRHFTKRLSFRVSEPAQVFFEQRETADVPVVFSGGDGCLQQDANRSRHMITLSL